jgi:hypothetical protein
MAADRMVTLHIPSLPRQQVSDILAQYLALDHARAVRRLLIVRCGLLALLVALVEGVVPGFSRGARVLSVVLMLVPAAWAWQAELRIEWRLGQRLGAIPDVLRKS